MKKNTISFLILITVLTIAACNNASPSANGKREAGNGFGDSIPASNGLVGKIFLLPDTTTLLPRFDTMKPLDSKIYVQEINVPMQEWSAGFPGLRNRFEWFGIEYTCDFKTNHPGDYVFRLLSDDGSKLFIDDTLIIDNDGKHAVKSKSGNIFLNSSLHSAKIQYFQGPRYQLALQLFWNMKDSTEQIFPGKNFMLFAKELSGFPWWIILVAALIITAGFIFLLKKKRKTSLINMSKEKDFKYLLNR